MPHISIKGPEIPLDAKRKLVEKMTEIASEAYGMPKEKFMIHIFECPKENIAMGGVLVVDR
ncbi:MAG TPA: 4-oxalocrotonate tautomerase DmpI [Desulfomonilaceae bacterium]|nr:4-oxalocrotonate tautomerase DmpI [Desulfomonilaceae bacterium]